ncbi:hypothetical protein [Candidatus Contubernalis alkaliaceticus]|uniref:hypothetical protein n=1 Tax=Candidatus Contubernalis alkaliaceticus TaxID=338645 RepID=UPI001F4BE663|nr:hypothetical protein [Candidatus Contubernalis alkalaceticus]UNC91068.1 hypothetical protein HUE98_02590 [Candidatus Contubernalis alkalaceticus]
MGEYEKNLLSETEHLEQTLSIIKTQIENELVETAEKKKKLIAFRRDMYENTSHFSNDFDKLTEMVQYLSPLEVQTYDYEASQKRIEQYKKLLYSPYFARIDFIEEGFDKECIYIGMGNLTDHETMNTFWTEKRPQPYL